MNIILTCAGRRNYLIDYFRDALSECGGKVFATNSIEESTALITADEGFLVPSIYSPGYIDVLISLCKSHDISAVISLFDLELPILARARDAFRENGIAVVVSSPEVVEICNDKWKTCQFVSELHLLTPKTFLTLNSALEAFSGGQVEFPLMIKPRMGTGSIGIFEAENAAELKILYEKAQRAIARSYLATESDKSGNEAVLIQEKIRGDEFGLDIINDLNGNYVATLVKKKIAMRSGETDSAITVNEPLLERIGETVARALRHVANLDVDVIVNSAGAHIIELNPRFGGGYPFSHLAGADLPRAIIAWLEGRTPDSNWFSIAYDVEGLKGIIPMRLDINSITHFG